MQRFNPPSRISQQSLLLFFLREKAVSALQSGMTEARVVRRFGAHRCTISRPWERRAPSGIQLNTWGTIWTVEYSGCWIFDLKAMFSALASLPLFDCHIWVRKDVQITGLTAAINNNNNGLTLSCWLSAGKT